MTGIAPLCPKCKSPLRPMEIPKWVQIGANLAVLGLIVVMLPIAVLVAFSLKAPPATWGVVEFAIPIVIPAIAGLVGFLFRKANQAPPYYCQTCHRRYSWRSVKGMWRIGSNVEPPAVPRSPGR